jgi:hypothetical protein
MYPIVLLGSLTTFFLLASWLTCYPWTYFWHMMSLTINLWDFLYGLNHKLVHQTNKKSFFQWMFSRIDQPWYRWWTTFYEQNAHYDKRYAYSDNLIVSLAQAEILDVLFSFLVIVTGINPILMIILASFHIFGTVVYFMPLIRGDRWLFTNNKLELIFLVCLPNLIWIIVPILMIVEANNRLL